MTENTPYQQLTRTFQRLSRFSHLAAIAGWDMFAMMPPGGSVARGEALAELGVLQHQILTDKKVGQWLQEARQQDLNDVEQANLREMQRQYDQAALLPESLVEAKSLAGSRCEHAWRSQRPANDWTGFADNLREVVRLSRQEAQIRADAVGRLTLRRAAGYFRTGYDQRAAGQPVRRSQIVATFLLSQAVEKQAKQTLIAPQGLSPLLNNASWACRRCVSLALTSTAGASTSALTRSAAAYPRMCASPPATTKTTCSALCSA